MSKVLVVDDDLMVSQMIMDWLQSQNHVAEVVHDGADALDRLKFYSYDLVILDWSLPKVTGVDVLRQYRNSGGKTPVIMLTGKGSMTDKEQGFSSGADDYLTKPFDIRELSMRVQALLRRPSGLVNPAQPKGKYSLDYVSHSFVRGDERIGLLPKEFALVEFLLRHPNQSFTPEQLLDRVWHSESDSSIHAIRTCIKRIREKIDEQDRPSIIVSERGYGYKIDL